MIDVHASRSAATHAGQLQAHVLRRCKHTHVVYGLNPALKNVNFGSKDRRSGFELCSIAGKKTEKHKTESVVTHAPLENVLIWNPPESYMEFRGMGGTIQSRRWEAMMCHQSNESRRRSADAIKRFGYCGAPSRSFSALSTSKLSRKWMFCSNTSSVTCVQQATVTHSTATPAGDHACGIATTQCTS